MKNNSYNIESLRKIIRELQKENRILRKKLNEYDKALLIDDIDKEKLEENDNYDLDQGGRIINRYITNEMVLGYFSLFRGRKDVYAKRASNGGYYPQCENRWNDNCPINCGKEKTCSKDCAFKKYQELTGNTLLKHFIGYKEDRSDVIGIYPTLVDNTCRFLVFDFDDHKEKDDKWIRETKEFVEVCKENNLDVLVERSSSGNGSHVWIFFREAIKVPLARMFGNLLIDKCLDSIKISSFEYYDRMYPSQDSSNGLGSLIALPLQGRAVKNGNSCFVDENFNAYEDQWDVILNKVTRYSEKQIRDFITTWQTQFAEEEGKLISNNLYESVKPWRKNIRFNKEYVDGKIHIVLSNGVYVDSLNLYPKIQNQIKSIAAFDNPKYYKNRNLGYSNYNNPMAIYLGEDIDGYIHIPRGVLERLISLCKDAQIEIDINNERQNGRYINVEFNGTLKQEQDIAARKILDYEDGILEAATAFGKTVVCSYLIASRKVNTLILLQSTSLINQWEKELNKFLVINEKLPQYKTKSGRTKTRESVYGILHGSKNTLGGIVDIAMIGSLVNREDKEEILSNYGMVIFDECHHGASDTAVDILSRVKSRYLYGVSATPYRSDNLEKINYMLLGPVRITYSAKQRNDAQNIEHYIYPKYTRVVDNYESKNDINSAYSLISKSVIRNNMIIDDVKECIENNRTPLILTKQKDHAKYLYDNLLNCADNVYIIYGDNSDKENENIISEMKNVPDEQSLILIATGQKVGEGFDFPRLDTLFMASPVSFKGRVEQYVGRLSRDYKNKKDVIVYDYIDSHVRYFKNMYYKRLKTYKSIGYLIKDDIKEKQYANYIYDSSNYINVFEKDINEANKSIIISSPSINEEKVYKLIYLIKDRQEAGVNVGVVIGDDNDESLIYDMRKVGIEVIEKEDLQECFAVIDDDLVWHGGMNLLGKADIFDNLMRIKSVEAASELLMKEYEGKE